MSELTQPRFEAETVVSVSKDQTSAQMPEEVVILGSRTGTYYGLDGVGADVWEALQEPTTVESIHQRILDRYDVGDEESRRDLLELLRDLHRSSLIEVHDTSPG